MSDSEKPRRNDFYRALLLDARKKAGLTQNELATKLGQSQSFISKYESGERRLDVLEFVDVAEALSIDIPDFFKKLKRSTSR